MSNSFVPIATYTSDLDNKKGVHNLFTLLLDWNFTPNYYHISFLMIYFLTKYLPYLRTSIFEYIFVLIRQN